jgi:hypothetical protein
MYEDDWVKLVVMAEKNERIGVLEWVFMIDLVDILCLGTMDA